MIRHTFSVSSHRTSLSKAKPDYRYRRESMFSSTPIINQYSFKPELKASKFVNYENTGKLRIGGNVLKISTHQPRNDKYDSICSMSSISIDYTRNRKFGSSLSKTGQCAVLKCYEDEIFYRLKQRFPYRMFPRVSTPAFELSLNKEKQKHTHSAVSETNVASPKQWESNSIVSEPACTEPANKHKTEEKLRSYFVDKQITAAIEILDDLKKISPLASDNNECIYESVESFAGSELCETESMMSHQRTLSTLNCDSERFFNQIWKKYENWYSEWSRMLNVLF